MQLSNHPYVPYKRQSGEAVTFITGDTIKREKSSPSFEIYLQSTYHVMWRRTSKARGGGTRGTDMDRRRNRAQKNHLAVPTGTNHRKIAAPLLSPRMERAKQGHCTPSCPHSEQTWHGVPRIQSVFLICHIHSPRMYVLILTFRDALHLYFKRCM